MPLLAELLELSDNRFLQICRPYVTPNACDFENRICSSLNIPFHECKLLMRKGMSERRWRVQFAGSVAT